MAYSPALARRLRLGLIGDGAGPLDTHQLGAASAFRTLPDGEIVRQVPGGGAGTVTSAALTRILPNHRHALVFDAQLAPGGETTADTLAEATLWLLNQGVDMVLFCLGTEHTNPALNASLERCHSVGVSLLAGVTSTWPASHTAVLGVAAQPHQHGGLHWVGGDACSVLHGETADPAAAIGDVASLALSGVAKGLSADALADHVRAACQRTERRAG
ncbi:MAG: hypothetical protein AAGA11_01360 [Pseudomonadota bacterium]